MRRPGAIVSAALKLSFESTSSDGAILVTKHKTFRDNAERIDHFKQYILRNYKAWSIFAGEQGHGIDVEDLILVTGRDMTEDFSMVAFSQNEGRIEMQFEAGASKLGSASFSAWGSWLCELPVFENWGPQERVPHVPNESNADVGYGMESDTPKYQQCVFLRGYRIYRMARIFPRVLRAGAGPHDLGPGHWEDDQEVSPFLVSDANDAPMDEDTPEFLEDGDQMFAALNYPAVSEHILQCFQRLTRRSNFKTR